MKGFRRTFIFGIGLLMLIARMVVTTAQQPAGALSGQVTDEFGGLIVGALVTLEDSQQIVSSAETDGGGAYHFNRLTAGNYKLTVKAKGFAPYEKAIVEITPGRNTSLNCKLQVALEAEKVVVSDATTGLDVDPGNDASALVLKGADLDVLPDDPDELADTLEQMAGAPGSGQLYQDGFTVPRLTSKKNIREIRINQNPFSAEYSSLGLNRIDVLTKPGTEKFHGQASFNFNDESLNARDPFALVRPPFQSRSFDGSLSGPLIKLKSSFFMDFEHRAVADNAIINATGVDSSFNIVPVNQSIVTPRARTAFTLRINQKLNNENTLVVRYSNAKARAQNAGVGAFALPSVGFDTAETDHDLQLTETAVINRKVVSETRFQFGCERLSQSGRNSMPMVNVLDAFIGGGSLPGQSHTDARHWEIQNSTSWTKQAHTLRAGVRLRLVQLQDVSQFNFGGTFTFAGGTAVKLDADNQVVRVGGLPVFEPITSIERYRRTLLFQQQGLPPDLSGLSLSDLGFGATQFSQAIGLPAAHVDQLEFATFMQDDWRVRPNFTLSLGLRYEKQSNIKSDLNLAPRLRFAWSPRAAQGRQARTVIRGGIGIFYDRVPEELTLRARRYDGVTQQLLIITDPKLLQFFPFAPATTGLAGLAVPQTIVQVADNLRAPYTIQTAFGIDRQLPHHLMVSATLLSARGLHLLRSRNINAPLPGTFTLGERASGVRPLGGINNVFQYESSGVSNQQQLLIRVTNRLSRDLTLFGTYVLNRVDSNTDGPSSFPENSYELSDEYGRSLFDVRHRFFLGGNINAPWGLHFNPFIIASSGRPFNIITGRDTNGDTLFTERPAFATDLSKPGVIVTRFGAFDPYPVPGQALIPRNYGDGPALFSVDLRVSKTISFGGGGTGRSGAKLLQPGGDPTGDATGGQPNEKRYGLMLSVRVRNLLNRLNPGTPIGNLSSSRFGQSNASAGNINFIGGSPALGSRRIEAQIGFTF